MKRLLIILLFLSPSAWAATWYIIPNSASYGNGITNCNGTVDVAYTTNAGPNCAVGRLYDILQWTSDGSTTQGTQRISGGDTIILDDNGTHWPIGADRSNTPTGCNSGFPYACVLLPIPSGSDSSHTTKIYGKNWNTGCSSAAQLYGTQSVQEIFNLSGSNNIDMECLDLTDHSSCGFRVGGNQCSEAYPADVGVYGRDAIYATSGNNFILKNVDIHGLSNEGLNISQLNTLSMDHVEIDGNNFGGLDGDIGGLTAWTGTITVNDTKTRFSGCGEAYPPSSSFNTADYTNCVDQNEGGYGDGWGFNTTGGNFNITNSEWSHNTSDGLDLLYGQNVTTLNIDKSLFEGNDGNQLKFTAKNMNLTNSLLIANCDYFSKTGKAYLTFTDCRANGTPISATPVLASAWKFINNSSVTATGSGGSAFIESSDRYATCNGTETYAYSNNVFENYNNTWTTYYNGLAGACSTAWNASTTNHSDIYNFTSFPSGTGVVTTNPVWSGSISLTANTNVPNIYLMGTSPGKGNGVSNSYWNTSNDYNNFTQNSPIDMGGLQFGSVTQCVLPPGACVSSTDCCVGTCSNFICSGSPPPRTVNVTIGGNSKVNGTF